ncbi:PREDICTED: thyroid transcription factor 1-associated protein 26 homolog [Cyphomyrmex costatus]|uniref:Thyroid transcription factor 1-associated protein 26 like protein n=1 Tax=Cyphomyrmex costatus TaxID=456900 RepID=A0A151IK09_9HYME|nr:PREDICTED: thyroid transcription factor 1-associated protein 26 homolog [Cyphomyrmex costatus]KYN03974.1 Thyroid transcription factor 1-associated protein 26 like protein [Cyphomyrmex costatus]
MKNNAKKMKDKNRTDESNIGNKDRKKTFDKKKYRLQKYSNKYKINRWEEKRKEFVLREYYKELKKDQQNSIGTSSNLSNTSKNETNKSRKGYAFFKAKQQYRQKQEEKKNMLGNTIRIRIEREEALKKYKEKKLQNFKVLSKKTKRGQPVMKGRIEMVLEKIQQMT